MHNKLLTKDPGPKKMVHLNNKINKKICNQRKNPNKIFYKRKVSIKFHNLFKNSE